ncbi:hypothetical protein H7J86_05495 [Mycobacterium hackensackense]|uniref:hypothetical protein n=1 Tax=Mycobacterium hackensackense TaxID=228909 RepID=UPI002265AF49|nr:hypothetical protein [Mycobacterium hackensackense]MCV7251610.1 hypothetical protein [Mycobacterium hackensackense]
MTTGNTDTDTDDESVSLIFLSCDLTGSTIFKQTNPADLPDPWQKVFLQFYREFPQRIATTQLEMGTADLSFELWKPIGDELIFSCRVRSEDDVCNAVRTWLKSMADYELYSLDGIAMGTKGGAFIATFPGPDSRSSVPRLPFAEESDEDVVDLNRKAWEQQDHSKFVYDYFGPSIDTGFRVISKCDSRYFTLSVEVALAMLRRSAPGSLRRDEDTRDLMLLDFVELKGVWKNRRYPVIAIDTEFDDPVNAAYRNFETRGTPDQLHDLCEACYHSGEEWPSKLYLPQSWNPFYKAKPEDALADYLPATTAEGVEQRATEPEGALQLEGELDLGLVPKFEVARAYLSARPEDREIHGCMPNGEMLCGIISNDGDGPYVPNMPEPDPFDPDEADVCTSCKAEWAFLPDDYPHPDPDSYGDQGR